MEKILKSSIFWAIFVLATLVVFAFFTNLSRTFRAETDLLIVAKNELTAKNFDGIINDSLYLPESLSFYERVLLESRDVTDEFKGLSDSERQSRWEKEISLSRIDGSGIVRVSILNNDKNQAKEISRQSALSLANYLAKDYNIKTELDTKIVNGPISSRAISWGFIPLLFVSALSGAVISFLASWLILGFERLNFNFRTPQVSLPVSLKDILKKKEKLVFWEGQPFEIEKMEIPKGEEIKTEKKKEVKKEIKAEAPFQKTQVVAPVFPSGKKASAPDNLPISDEEAEFLAKTSFEPVEMEVGKEKFVEKTQETKSEIPEVKVEAEKIIDREPTEEEVRERMLKLEKVNNNNPSAEEAKKRLNDLLQGKI